MFSRGDVVLVRYPNSDLSTYKKRPALIVQDLTVKTGLAQMVVALIASNIARMGSTRVFVSKDSLAAQDMNLQSDSVIVADNLQAISEFAIGRKIGSCKVMGQVSDALRLTLAL